jgi:hypothetical protein
MYNFDLMSSLVYAIIGILLAIYQKKDLTKFGYMWKRILLKPCYVLACCKNL